MRKRKSRQIPEKQALRRELEEYRSNGWMICLNGRPSSPEKVVTACLRERCSYMRDFVSDEEEQVKKIDFIRIQERE